MSTERVTFDSLLPQEAAAPLPKSQSRGGSVFLAEFSRHGNSALYRTFGWSQQEETHVWSIGRSSGLRLPAPAEVTPLVLEIVFDICKVGDLLTTALIRVIVNDQLVAVAHAHGRSRLRCSIPASLISPGAPIDVRFEHPCYVRLNFADLGSDDRVLGICFYAAAIYPTWLQDYSRHLLPFASGEKLIESLPTSSEAVAEKLERTIYRDWASDDERSPQGEGWRPDASGNCWADARICHLEIAAPRQAGQYLARFDIAPLYVRTSLTRQRITVLLNGAAIGQFSTGTDTSFSLPLPEELIEFGRTLRFSFVNPDGLPIREIDARSEHQFLSFILDAIAIEPIPAAHRALTRLRDDDVEPLPAIAVSNRFLDESVDDLPRAVSDQLGLEVSNIMRLFESMGDNCAFGLAQQKSGAEVLGLLRFGSSPLKKLMTEMEHEFRSISDQKAITMRRDSNGEFVLLSESGLRWHTNVKDPDADQATLLAEQTTRLVYLKRKFYEGLKSGRKIFTIARADPRRQTMPIPKADEPDYWEEKPEPLRLSELLALFLAINSYAANALLYLVPCERGRRSGTVELIAPGIMRGFVDDFSIVPDPGKKDHAEWMRVAVNAWLLKQESDRATALSAP